MWLFDYFKTNETDGKEDKPKMVSVQEEREREYAEYTAKVHFSNGDTRTYTYVNREYDGELLQLTKPPYMVSANDYTEVALLNFSNVDSIDIVDIGTTTETYTVWAKKPKSEVD